jgi:hypothetical protein
MDRIRVIDIVKQYLINNGFDGLTWEYGECGCDLSDLMPCDTPNNCVPGYKWKNMDGCGWCMCTVKPTDEEKFVEVMANPGVIVTDAKPSEEAVLLSDNARQMLNYIDNGITSSMENRCEPKIIHSQDEIIEEFGNPGWLKHYVIYDLAKHSIVSGKPSGEVDDETSED